MHDLEHQRVHRCGLPRVCCSILPPDLLARLADEGKEGQRQAAIRTIATSSAIRARRALITNLVRTRGMDLAALGLATKALNRTVYDVGQGGWNDLPGRQVRSEGDDPSDDDSVNEAYDGADSTYTFYKEVYDRDSVDDAGYPLVSCVHFGVDIDNAFWDGGEMVYGDGSGQIFLVGSLTKSIDVIGHELTHGVTQYTAGLEYSKQSGALNESFSDVFGSLVKQYSLGQSAEEADWLIGEGILVPEFGEALRSMSDPDSSQVASAQPASYGRLSRPSRRRGPPQRQRRRPHQLGDSEQGFLPRRDGDRRERMGSPGTDLVPDADAASRADVAVSRSGRGDRRGSRRSLRSGGSEEQAVQRAWEEVGVLG